MQFYYGEQMPFRILDEAVNWKVQEANYTALMGRVMGHLQREQLSDLKHWKDALDTTHRHVLRFIESATRANQQFALHLHEQVLELIYSCMQESVGFIHFCRQLKIKNRSIQHNPIALEIIDHVIHQSDQFIGYAQTVLYHKR